MLTIDTSDLDRVTRLFRERADNMVPDGMREGQRRADAYKSSGGRYRDPSSRRYSFSSAPGRARRSRASGSQVARMTEKVFYNRFLTFWDSNW
jgi:hypothetical protein